MQKWTFNVILIDIPYIYKGKKWAISVTPERSMTSDVLEFVKYGIRWDLSRLRALISLRPGTSKRVENDLLAITSA